MIIFVYHDKSIVGILQKKLLMKIREVNFIKFDLRVQEMIRLFEEVVQRLIRSSMMNITQYMFFYINNLMKDREQQTNNPNDKAVRKDSKLIVQSSQQSRKTYEQDPFQFTQMKKELATINTPEEQRTYTDPLLQVNQPVSTQLHQKTKQDNNNEKKEGSGQYQQNQRQSQHWRSHHRGHHKGYHRGHHHYHQQGYQQRDQDDPQNQQEYSDQYWQQVHDRRNHHPHFNHYNFRGENQPGNRHFQMRPTFPPPPHFYRQNLQKNLPNYPNDLPPQPAYFPVSPNFPIQNFPANGYPPYGHLHYPFYQNQAYQAQNRQTIGQNTSESMQSESISVQRNHNHQKKRFKQRGEKQQKCWRRRRGQRRSRSRSKSRKTSSFSSDQSKEEQLSQSCKQYVQNITSVYTSQLQNLFQSRSINTLQRVKIIKLLIDRYPQYEAPFQSIFECLNYLQSYNLLYQVPYIKAIKVILKFNFNMAYASPKIQRIQAKKIKKIEADLKYNQLYGDVDVQPLLQHGTLIDMDQTNVMYLIDGNNILPTQKHFRKYFQSNEKLQKVEAQLCCQWLLSFALEPQNCFLFFDEKYSEEDMKKVKSYLFLNQQQIERANKIKVIYGDQTTADDKIVQKLTQLSTEDSKTKKEVILVSADRELYMRCMKITKLKHTGGRFFFKFIKYVGVHRNKQEKQVKKLIKKIFSYSH